MHPQPQNEDTPSPDERVSVQVDEPFAASVDAADLAATIQAALAAEGRAADGEVTLVITDDETVHALNLQYLGEDHPTDVLSFPTAETEPPTAPAGAASAHFVTAPEAARYLGDIIIAFPYAERQAAGLGHAVCDELRLLAVHGTLHLLGYDHADAEQQAAMWARQDAILSQLSA